VEKRAVGRSVVDSRDEITAKEMRLKIQSVLLPYGLESEMRKRHEMGKRCRHGR